MGNQVNAGQLIFSNIGLYNQAAELFNNTLEPKFREGLSECVEYFSKKHGWMFECKHDDNKKNENFWWFAEKRWKLPGCEEDSNHKAAIWIGCINLNDNDSWTALFCNQAIEGGQAGLAFWLKDSIFRNKNIWKNYCKNIDSAWSKELEELGFQNHDNGQCFFLPVQLDAQALAHSWAEYEEFTGDDDAFIPLRQAFETVQKAMPVFDRIIDGISPAYLKNQEDGQDG